MCVIGFHNYWVMSYMAGVERHAVVKASELLDLDTTTQQPSASYLYLLSCTHMTINKCASFPENEVALEL